MSCDYSKLRGRIKEVFETQEKFAAAIGIGRVSLSKKLNGNSDFSSSEIAKSINVLNIDKDEISQYFFTSKV